MKINVRDYKQFYFDTALKIFNTPSPTGYYKEIEGVLKDYATQFGVEFERTNKGCFILTLKGKSEKALGLAAHADTLGAMVRSISGTNVKFTKIGGPVLTTYDGEYCTIITRDGKKYSGTFLSVAPSKHVFAESDTIQRTEENMYVRLDEVIKNADDVRKLGIETGDYIVLEPKTTITESGYLKSRFIDDKASVVALLTVIKMLKDHNITPEYTLKFLITMYEEVGHGASYIPDNVQKMLCVDMGCIGKDLNCNEHQVSICAKDSHGPYDYDFTSQLIELAKQNKLDYAVDVYPYYGSDIGAMWSAGYDIPGALIGTGVHASHGMERTHFDGIANTLSLILLYIGL